MQLRSDQYAIYTTMNYAHCNVFVLSRITNPDDINDDDKNDDDLLYYYSNTMCTPIRSKKTGVR